MVSILFQTFLTIYDFIFGNILSFFNLNIQTLENFITYPVKFLISLKKIMPITIGAIQQMVDLWILIFFAWGIINIFLKIVQVFIPNKMVE